MTRVFWAAGSTCFFANLISCRNRSRTLIPPRTCLAVISFFVLGVSSSVFVGHFRECQLLIPVMRLGQGHPLCPGRPSTRTPYFTISGHSHLQPRSQGFSLLNWVGGFKREKPWERGCPTSPAFLRSSSGHASPITNNDFTAMLRKTLGQAGFPASKFPCHSFRRGGATYAFRCGAPVELISLQGD